MWFKRLFKGNKGPDESTAGAAAEPTVNQGIFYLYLIIILQVVFIFALVGIIMFVGKVLATPGWVFLFAFLSGMAGCVYIYRKAKLHLRKFRDSLQRVNLSDRNYEISFMGGMLTMRVEQNSQKLLAAPQAGGATVLDADTIDTPPASH